MKCILIAVLSLVLAAIFIYFEHEKKYVPAVIFKGLASLCFVYLGYIGYQLSGKTEFGRLVVIGLSLGCIADILLNLRFVFDKIGTKIFLVGILVFLAGHIMYLAALIPECGYLQVCVLIGILMTYVILHWIFSIITAKKAFKIFGVFYIGTVVLMTCVAFGVAFTNPCPRTWLFFLGAVLFLISDIVFILNTFGKETKFSLRITNLSLYYIGQILIALTLQLL